MRWLSLPLLHCICILVRPAVPFAAHRLITQHQTVRVFDLSARRPLARSDKAQDGDDHMMTTYAYPQTDTVSTRVRLVLLPRSPRDQGTFALRLEEADERGDAVAVAALRRTQAGLGDHAGAAGLGDDKSTVRSQSRGIRERQNSNEMHEPEEEEKDAEDLEAQRTHLYRPCISSMRQQH